MLFHKKKTGTVECKEYHTVALILQLGKVILRVIGWRIMGNLKEIVEDQQHGLKKEKRTRNAFFPTKNYHTKSLGNEKNCASGVDTFKKPAIL